MDPKPQIATRADFAEILSRPAAFWGDRDVRHLHHPTAIEEFGDGALVVRDAEGSVAAYLLGMVLGDRGLGYVHAVAVRDDRRGAGHGRRLYDAFFALAAARGCDRVKAITTPRNTGSIAFHRALGMDAAEVADYSGPGQPRVVFTRALRPAPTPPWPGTIVRAARLSDVDAVLAFWARAAEDADRPADVPAAVRGLIARDPEALVLVTSESDEILGSVVIGWDGWRAHLYRLAVDPAHRRRGLGRWLLAHAERRLRALGAIRIDAMVLDANTSAAAVWSAAGYRPQENWSRWVKPL